LRRLWTTRIARQIAGNNSVLITAVGTPPQAISKTARVMTGDSRYQDCFSIFLILLYTITSQALLSSQSVLLGRFRWWRETVHVLADLVGVLLQFQRRRADLRQGLRAELHAINEL